MRISISLATLILAAVLQPNTAHAQQTGQPGQFDYYLLTLSWSPEFCYSHRSAAECSQHLGFIVHGLWPQFNDGSYPQHCSNQPGLSDPSKVADIMPDPSLVEHEWSTHGTCSGLGPDQYFGLIEQDFHSVQIPAALNNPTRSATMRPSQIKQAFVQANSGLSASGIAVTCRGGYLTGIEIAMSKDGQPIAFPTPTREDCRSSTIRIPPIR